MELLFGLILVCVVGILVYCTYVIEDDDWENDLTPEQLEELDNSEWCMFTPGLYYKPPSPRLNESKGTYVPSPNMPSPPLPSMLVKSNVEEYEIEDSTLISIPEDVVRLLPLNQLILITTTATPGLVKIIKI